MAGYMALITMYYVAVIAIRSLERTARDGAAALLGLTPYAALISLSALWVLWSPSDIFADHPRLIMWTVGLLFAKVHLIAFTWSCTTRKLTPFCYC